MLKAVFFDFDGTIVDSLKHQLHAYREVFKYFGKNPTDREIVKYSFYTTTEEKTARYGITDIEKFREIFSKNLDAGFKSAKITKEVFSVLSFLRKKKIHTAIISMARNKRVSGYLKDLEAYDLFDLVLGGDDVSESKPDPEGVLKAADHFKLKPEECLFIGDTDLDMIAGKKAGVMTGLYLPEANRLYGDIDLFRKTEPDFEFPDYRELPKILKRFL